MNIIFEDRFKRVEIELFNDAKYDHSVVLPNQVNLNGLLLFIAVVVSAVPLFWFGLVSLQKAWAVPEYSHGPLIPLVSAYLFLRDMKQVPSLDREIRDRMPGYAFIVLAILFAIVGNVSRIPDIVTYGLIVWIWGMVLVCFGYKRGVLFWAGVLHLVFMLPLPNIIYWQVSTTLQFISSEIGVAFIRLMDIPVFLDGNIIDLGQYKLQVAEACSGLRYLFPVMSFSYIYAILYQGPRWHKIVLLVSAAPITILMNSFRIGVIGVLVDNYGIEQAEGFLHTFEGWVIFGACVAILFGLAVVMQRFSSNPLPLNETIDLDFDGVWAQFTRVRDQVPSKALLLSFVTVFLVSATMMAWPSPTEQIVDRKKFIEFTRKIDDWKGVFHFIDPVIERVLEADDYLLADYVSKDEVAPVNLFVAFYNNLTEGSGVHSPEVCIPAGGWEMSDIVKKEITLDGLDEPLVVNRAIIQNGLRRQLVYYYFDQRGRKLTSAYLAKAYSIWDAFTINRDDGGLVRVITPIVDGENDSAADARLLRFMNEAIPELKGYVPN